MLGEITTTEHQARRLDTLDTPRSVHPFHFTSRPSFGSQTPSKNAHIHLREVLEDIYVLGATLVATSL